MRLNKGQKLNLEINGISIKTTEEVKFLGIKIDSKFQFQSQVEALYKTENKKDNVFSRIAGYLPIHKASVLCKTFIRSTFNYSPLIRVLCGKTSNNRINIA